MSHAAEAAESRREQRGGVPGHGLGSARLTLVGPAHAGGDAQDRRRPAEGGVHCASAAPLCREVTGRGENGAQLFITQEAGRRLDTELCRHRHISHKRGDRKSHCFPLRERPPDGESVGLFLRVTNPLRENKGSVIFSKPDGPIKLTGFKLAVLQTSIRFVCLLVASLWAGILLSAWWEEGQSFLLGVLREFSVISE